MAAKPTHTPVMNARIPVKLREEFRAAAAAQGQTLTQGLIEAMNMYLRAHPNRPRKR